MRSQIIIAICLLGAITSCDNCPPDQLVGEIRIKEGSQDFLPMTVPGEAVFTDSTGRRVAFETSGLQVETDSTVTVIPCAKGIGGGATYYYLSGEEWIEVVQ